MHYATKINLLEMKRQPELQSCSTIGVLLIRQIGTTATELAGMPSSAFRQKEE